MAPSEKMMVVLLFLGLGMCGGYGLVKRGGRRGGKLRRSQRDGISLFFFFFSWLLLSAFSLCIYIYMTDVLDYISSNVFLFS